MRVRNNSIYMGDDRAIKRAAAQENGSDKRKTQNSINAANLREKFDPVANKKKNAKNQALRIIKQAIESDRSIDTSVEDRRKKIRDLTKDIGDNNKEINKIENTRRSLRASYGVKEDSDEEKDLKLLAKEAESKFRGSDVRLTDEEVERLKEIKKEELTDYQKHSLELKKSESTYYDRIYEAEKEISMHNAIISGTKLERLKSNPMFEARKRAEAVMVSAEDEIKQMLFEEGKNNIDEKLEEEKEAAKEKREKEEEIKERIEKVKDKKEEQKKFTEEILEATTKIEIGVADINGAQEQVKEMMNKLKLLEEDIKGAAVDKEV